MSERVLREGDDNPITERARTIIAELYQDAGDFEGLCSGWPCDEVRWMAYRIAELEADCAELKTKQCKCPSSDPNTTDETGN